jgi:predicted regulator of Ras-like GTPase activity (Roadblock/LC7/MglB family)
MEIFTKKQQENIDEVLKNADHQTVCRILEAVLKMASKVVQKIKEGEFELKTILKNHLKKQNNINTKK